MRWPIRNQILLPFASIQIASVVAVTAFSAWVGVNSAERQIKTRLNNVVETIENRTYPLTPAILNQLHDLSGADFVVIDRQGNWLGATLSVQQFQLDSSQLPSVKPGEIDTLPVITIESKSYFAGFADKNPGRVLNRVLVLYPENVWQKARSRAIFVPLLTGTLILVITLLTSVWIARRIASRVQDVEQHVARISSGDFSPVPCGLIDDELNNLSLTVNHMAEALERSMQQARDSERASTLTQLAGGLAHNLRNALTGARVSIQLHQKRCSNADDEAVRIALSEVSRTEELIQSLLRVSQGRQLKSEPAEINSIVDDVVSLITPLCQHRQVDFNFQQNDCSIVVEDGQAIRGALINLLTNAIEAAGPQGRVNFELSQNRNRFIARICDNGDGIPAEHLDKIFSPFFTTKKEGIGIGLTVARKAVEDCGGTLTVSREDDETVFEIMIPVVDQSVLSPNDSPSQAKDRQQNLSQTEYDRHE